MILVAPASKSMGSNLAAIYTYKNITINTDCNIYIYENGKYEFFLETQETDDIVFSHLLSIGKYTIKDNLIILYDSYNKYQQEFLFNNNYLVSKKTFQFLQNKKLEKNDLIKSLKPMFKDSDFEFLSNQIILFKIKNPLAYRLYFDTYQGYNGLKIQLRVDSTYKLTFKNIILSEGKFSRSGNVLKMFDSSLSHTFFMLISNNKELICKFFPGDDRYFLMSRD